MILQLNKLNSINIFDQSNHILGACRGLVANAVRDNGLLLITLAATFWELFVRVETRLDAGASAVDSGPPPVAVGAPIGAVTGASYKLVVAKLMLETAHEINKNL